MTIPSTQNLDRIVDISVEVSPLAAPRATFNELLIVGSTAGIIDTTERLRVYEDPDDMLTDGYVVTDPEYVAALIYFGQTPAPRRLWVGYQDLVTSPAESCLEAIQACRLLEASWYYVVALNSVKADHEEIALWTESAVPSTVYGFTSGDADLIVAPTSPPGIFEYLKALGYSRTIGQYSTVQSDVYPNNIYAIIGIIGYACGQNTGLAGSAFTLKFKNETGISTEPLTTTQIGYIENQNGNVYLSYGNFYNFFEQGVMSDGSFLDERVNLDMLVNNMQLTISDLLNSTPKIPQTDAGVTQIIQAINEACELAVNVGFLAPGTWRGVNILNLKNGDTLPRGYLVQAAPLSEQSTADRQLRKSTPLYVAITEAGAVHSLVIAVRVTR